MSFVNIVKRKYPNIKFLNFGKPGETVKSLHTRLSKTKLESNFVLIFLWIGTNDVYSKLLKVQAQPIVEDHREFNDYFSKMLNMVIPFSKYVVVVSPAIVGENLNNQPNCELRDLSSVIENISKQYSNVSFLDIQSVFEERLANVHSSDYISTSVMTVMKDVLFYRNPVRIDRLSRKRGLHLTLDGIHLNSEGALCVAEKYALMIDQLLFAKSSTIQSQK
ncbi:Uncharacterized protein BC88300_02136 [Bacillus cytotoxicus]|nr:Uncharacterized protein BC88300_02136 [Bacillus cytotoxicus]